MNSVDEQYLDVMDTIIKTGDHVQGRNGGVRTLFGTQMLFSDVENEFPLLTTKKVHFKSIVVELLWFIKGLTNVDYLHKYGVTIWDEWADPDGELGPVYGKQWRSWPTGKMLPPSPDVYYSPLQYETIDQFTKVIEGIKQNPYGRRHIVSAWNPAEIEDMALPPCHTLFQFHVRSNGTLDLQLYQRSADWFLGVPFNIASYALLLILVAKETGLKAGDFIHTFGNYHLYDNHEEQALEQLSRNGKPLPKVRIADKSIFDLEPEDITLENYDPHPLIKAPVSR